MAIVCPTMKFFRGNSDSALGMATALRLSHEWAAAWGLFFVPDDSNMRLHLSVAGCDGTLAKFWRKMLRKV